MIEAFCVRLFHAPVSEKKGKRLFPRFFLTISPLPLQFHVINISKIGQTYKLFCINVTM